MNKGRNTKKEKRTSRIEKMLESLIQRQEKTDEQIEKTFKSIEELKLRQEKNDEQIEKTFKSIEELKLRQEKTDEQIRELKLRQEETDKQIRELRLRQEKTDEQIKQTYKMIEELKMRQEKTDEQIRELKLRQEKTDEQLRETDRKIKEAIDEMRKRVGELTDSQGLFWESISEKGIRKFLEDNGYKVKIISRHVMAKSLSGDEGEFDIIFEVERDGEEEFFIAEVKSTAHPGCINEFLAKLRAIFEFFPRFRGKKIWGVFSSGRYGDGTERYAIKNGLITFGVSGEVVYVLNAPDEIKPFFG